MTWASSPFERVYLPTRISAEARIVAHGEESELRALLRRGTWRGLLGREVFKQVYDQLPAGAQFYDA